MSKLQRSYHQDQSGFSLIEMLVYVSIIGLIISGLSGFLWNILTIQAKSRKIAESTHSLAATIYRLQIDLWEATDIATASGTLTLTMNEGTRNPTIYSVENGRLRVGIGTEGDCNSTNPCALTPGWVTIAPFSIESSGAQSPQHIQVGIQASSTTNRAEWNISQQYQLSTQRRTPY